MTKEKFVWFNLENYEPSKNFSAKEWALEVKQRLLMEYFISEENKNARTPKEQYEYKLGIEMCEHIKKFGLFNNNLLKSHVPELDKKIDDKSLFLKDLSVQEAYGFLYYSDKKDDFINDMSNWDQCAIGSDAAKKWSKIVNDKYDNAISDELTKMYGREDQLQNNEFGLNYDSGCRYLNVDLNTTDEILRNEFNKWLQLQRNNYDIEYPENNFKKSQYFDWYKNHLLAYWDIVTLSKFDSFTITNEAIGRLLFPDEYDVAISERIRKVVRPKSKRIMNWEIAEILSSQAHME